VYFFALEFFQSARARPLVLENSPLCLCTMCVLLPSQNYSPRKQMFILYTYRRTVQRPKRGKTFFSCWILGMPNWRHVVFLLSNCVGGRRRANSISCLFQMKFEGPPLFLCFVRPPPHSSFLERGVHCV